MPSVAVYGSVISGARSVSARVAPTLLTFIPTFKLLPGEAERSSPAALTMMARLNWSLLSLSRFVSLSRASGSSKRVDSVSAAKASSRRLFTKN